MAIGGYDCLANEGSRWNMYGSGSNLMDPFRPVWKFTISIAINSTIALRIYSWLHGWSTSESTAVVNFVMASGGNGAANVPSSNHWMHFTITQAAMGSWVFVKSVPADWRWNTSGGADSGWSRLRKPQQVMPRFWKEQRSDEPVTSSTRIGHVPPSGSGNHLPWL